MKRLLLLTLLAIAVLAGVLVTRALTLESRQITAPAAPPLKGDAFIAWLAQAYPPVHAPTQPPFSGAAVDDHVWRRATLDDKFTVIAGTLFARGSGGHSSMPPPRTEVGSIAVAAIVTPFLVAGAIDGRVSVDGYLNAIRFHRTLILNMGA